MLDAISLSRLSLVHPELSRRIHNLADMLSFDIRVTQGLRTYSQQNALYQQGRTLPGKIVTNAQGGFSAHCFGYAVDVVPILDGVIDWNGKDDKWAEILAKAPSCGLAEGATWRSFPDEPHLYLQELPADPDDTMRYNFEEGGIGAVWKEFPLAG